MKRAFLMIEVVIALLGLSLLLSSTTLIYKDRGKRTSYQFIPVTQKCEISCALQKLQP